MTLFEMAEQFPPAVCRYLARKRNGHTPMSHRDLAKIVGISKSQVAVLSLRKSWKGVPIDVVVKFSSACGVDLMRPSQALKYIRKAKRVHIENASPAQKKFFVRLFTRSE
jgi:3,4-dihydroxy-2-butanone 4-phosphate synthase